MFTGLVQQVGRVVSMEKIDFGADLCIDPCSWSYTPSPGDSIAVNGCCLTMTNSTSSSQLHFEVIKQTLDATTLGSLAPGDPVNLEHAVTPTTLMGGHIVQGHIDGVASVEQVTKTEEEWRIRVRPAVDLLECIIEKGSVALEGVSLTVAATEYEHGYFEVALIPTTLNHTTLGNLQTGDRINLETDSIVKTVIHWLQRQSGPGLSQ